MAGVFRRTLSSGDGSPLGAWTNFPVSLIGNGTVSTSVSEKNWKERIRKRQSATTVMGVQAYEFVQRHDGFAERFYFRKTNGKVAYHVQLSGCLGATNRTIGSPSSAVNQTRVHNLTLSRFIAKANAAKRSLPGVVVAGEFGETVKMIHGLTQAVYRGNFTYLQNLSKRFKGKSRMRYTRAQRLIDAKKQISDSYLEFAFGMQPLYNDLHDAAMAAAHIVVGDRLPSVPVRAKAMESAVGATPISEVNTFGGALQLKRVYSTVDSFKEKLYGVIKVNNNWNGAVAELGLDLRSWVPSIWELLPYSFLVDYFTNMGGVIEALAFNRADLAWINIGTALERTLKLEDITIVDPPIGSSFYGDSRYLRPGTSYSATRRNLSRSPYEGLLVPSLEFQIPGMGVKWLNMAALLAQGRNTSHFINRYVSGGRNNWRTV